VLQRNDRELGRELPVAQDQPTEFAVDFDDDAIEREAVVQKTVVFFGRSESAARRCWA
jgi:hypothetical protein